ncbi:MAG: asparagine synthase (glutamine-hydrolyzing) [Thermodesulfovibrionia bacterium]|nr:asparagine synthase (glutamine-hydrolyzing) [Thermodesulfovibrionia bacterium]
MCGIAGIFNSGETVSPNDVRSMLDAAAHRGPDDSGITSFNTASGKWWGLPDGGGRSDLVLGHLRLSIIDLSSAGHQPMSDPGGRTWITYNGEIYNHLELRRRLQERGYIFKSATDTEVVLYAYKEYGHSCLKYFRGFFAFCIYDADRKELFMARDRLGLKPLKYYWDGQRFAFASEMKSLLELPWVSRTADTRAIDRYIAYRYIPSPLTGIKNIYKLPAGCSITFSLEKPEREIKPHQYWVPRFEPKTVISFDEAKESMLSLLGESVSMRMMSDVPIGVFLSGGLDSSAVVALLRQRHNGDIRTFSVGFPDEEFDERPFARSVAERYGTIHTELMAETDIGRDLQKIIWHFDEPFGDPSALPSFYLAKAASSHIKVVLNGDGGDEVFAGYKRYAIHARNRFLDYLPSSLHDAARYLSEMLPPDIDKRSFRGRPGRILESLSGGLTETYPLRFAGLSWKIRNSLYKGCPFIKAERYGWPAEINSLLDKTGARTAMERLMALDQVTYLPDDILVKSDLAGMSHGLEARSPFLDHVFVEWANSLPLSYKKDKHILKEAFRDYLPYDIIKRKKAGFNPPLARWMRTVLKESIESYLLSEDSPLSFMNRDVIKKMNDIHQSGRANMSEPLWSLLVLAVWTEKNRISF